MSTISVEIMKILDVKKGVIEGVLLRDEVTAKC